MAPKLSEFLSGDYKNKLHDDKTCYDCEYIERGSDGKPMQANLNEPAYCRKMEKIMKTDTKACGFFVPWKKMSAADYL